MNSGSSRFDEGHKQSIPADVDVDELLKNVACDCLAMISYLSLALGHRVRSLDGFQAQWKGFLIVMLIPAMVLVLGSYGEFGHACKGVFVVLVM